jgi:adenylate cyclase
MDRPPDPDLATEEFWRDFLTRGDAAERRVRGVLKRLPANPRCMLCAAPFAGVGAPIMRMIGKRPSDKNPTMCTTCFDFMAKHRGGAEIECSFLFADVRGSTSMAERMTATEFRGLLDRFYSIATTAVVEHDGSIEKFVGDEVVATYFPLLSGNRHTERAVETAMALLARTGHGEVGGPWLPLGAGVHTGPAWVGAVGDGPRVELTVLGDTVNITARLAAAAGIGEILVSAAAATASDLDAGLERRSLELKGKAAATDVVVVRVGAPVPD